MIQTGQRPARAALALLLLFLQACGGSDAGPAAPAAAGTGVAPAGERAESAPAPLADVVAGAGDGQLFPVTPRPESEAERENKRRLDPLADGWESEAAHDAIRPVLSAFLGEWTAPGDGRTDPEPFLARAFEGASALRPAALETVFDDGFTRVHRPAAELDPSLGAPGELAGRLEQALGPLAGARGLEALFQVVRIDGSGERYEITALLEVHGEVGELRLQQNATWRMAWELEAGAEGERDPKLRWIRLAAFEELESRGPYLEEHTRRLLADHAFWDREFRLGVGDYYYRQDHLTGNAFIGGQGIAVGDLDGDGLDDVYVAQQGGLPNRLFLHQSDDTLVDAAPALGLDVLDNTRGALIVDLDGDGRQDLALAVRSNVLVFFNSGKGRFGSKLLPGRVPEDVYSLSAADPDMDGDLDLYACRYGQRGVMSGVPVPYHDAENGAADSFWRNLGNRRFSEETREAGLMQNTTRFGLASIWEDFNQDGMIDLYVTNDFGRNNLYVNRVQGRFRDQADERGAEDMAAGMGASVADVDLDGWPDLLVTNMFSPEGLRIASRPEFMGGQHPELRQHYVRHARGNTLLHNRGDGTFEDVTEAAGVGMGRWGWGALFVDFDNDGLEDLYAPNGFITSRDPTDVSSFFWRRVVGQSPPAAGPTTEAYRAAWGSIQRMVMGAGLSWAGRERNCVQRNLGGLRFADVSYLSGADFPDDSRAVATVDWDDDGRLDLWLKNRTAPRVRFLRNALPSPGRYLKLDLRGTQCNRDAIGATVLVDQGERVLRKTLYAGDGYLAQSSKRLHFGLGAASEIEGVSVRWPGGAEERFTGLEPDSRYLLVQGSGRAEPVAARGASALEAALPETETPIELPTHRAVLVDKLPLGPLTIPSFEDPRRSIGDFAGRPLLVTLWRGSSPASRAQLRAFRGLAGDPEFRGPALVPLTLDEGPDLARSRAILAELGLSEGSGYADGALSQIVELVLFEVFARRESAPLPTSLLFDTGGQLAVIYRGCVDGAELLADAAQLAREQPEDTTDELFGGGSWFARGRRDYAGLAKVFGELGHERLAELYGSLAAE
jgi:hypothetical protein